MVLVHAMVIGQQAATLHVDRAALKRPIIRHHETGKADPIQVDLVIVDLAQVDLAEADLPIVDQELVDQAEVDQAEVDQAEVEVLVRILNDLLRWQWNLMRTKMES